MPNRPYLGRMVDDAIAMFKPHVSGTEGAVSANNPYAAEAGLEILKAGGNAFDAACAISLVLGVVEPYHSGIGGGCFHVFYDKKTDAFHAMDARGVAPKNAYQDMFLDKNGDVDLKLTEFSGRSVAVPRPVPGYGQSAEPVRHHDLGAGFRPRHPAWPGRASTAALPMPESATPPRPSTTRRSTRVSQSSIRTTASPGSSASW